MRVVSLFLLSLLGRYLINKGMRVLKIAINGINGKMGLEIVKLINQDNELELFEFNAGNLAVDVVIDFSSPIGCMEALNWCVIHKIPLVIGTTGLSIEQKTIIGNTANTIPIVLSPNMSLSVNIMFAISQLVAKYLPNAEVEIIEAHHRYKKDSPSGTAIGIGEAVASGRNQRLLDVAKFGRERQSGETRGNQEIGFAVVRGGDIVGKHTAMFILDGEELNITSNITDRKSFAFGAVLAAKFVVNQNQAMLYTMQDVLSLK